MKIRRREDGVTVDITVQPRAARVRIGPVIGDRLKVAVTAPPVDGAANQAVIEAVAKALGVAKSRIEVVRGHSSRQKTLLIRDVEPAAVEELAR